MFVAQLLLLAAGCSERFSLDAESSASQSACGPTDHRRFFDKPVMVGGRNVQFGWELEGISWEILSYYRPTHLSNAGRSRFPFNSDLSLPEDFDDEAWRLMSPQDQQSYVQRYVNRSEYQNPGARDIDWDAFVRLEPQDAEKGSSVLSFMGKRLTRDASGRWETHASTITETLNSWQQQAFSVRKAFRPGTNVDVRDDLDDEQAFFHCWMSFDKDSITAERAIALANFLAHANEYSALVSSMRDLDGFAALIPQSGRIEDIAIEQIQKMVTYSMPLQRGTGLPNENFVSLVERTVRGDAQRKYASVALRNFITDGSGESLQFLGDRRVAVEMRNGHSLSDCAGWFLQLLITLEDPHNDVVPAEGASAYRFLDLNDVERVSDLSFSRIDQNVFPNFSRNQATAVRQLLQWETDRLAALIADYDNLPTEVFQKDYEGRILLPLLNWEMRPNLMPLSQAIQQERVRFLRTLADVADRFPPSVRYAGDNDMVWIIAAYISDALAAWSGRLAITHHWLDIGW